MSIRLDLDRALAGANIPAEDIRPSSARIVAGSELGRLGSRIFEAFIGGRVRDIPPLEDPRSYGIFQQAKANFEAARPTVNRILSITESLRRNTEILNRESEFQNSLYVKIGKCALDCITASSLGIGFNLLRTTPLLSEESACITAGTIAGVAVPQAIKYCFLPDRTAAIQAKRADIAADTQTLNRLWVELEGDDPRYPTDDLLQAGYELEQQVSDNSITYSHLQRRFSVPNPAAQNPGTPVMQAIEAAPAERAQ